MYRFIFLFFICFVPNISFSHEISVCYPNTRDKDCSIFTADSHSSDDAEIIDNQSKPVSIGGEGYDNKNYELVKHDNVYLLTYANKSTQTSSYEYLFFLYDNKTIKILKFLAFNQEIDVNRGSTYWTAIYCVNNDKYRNNNLFVAGWNLCDHLEKKAQTERVNLEKFDNGYKFSVKALGDRNSTHEFWFKNESFSEPENIIDFGGFEPYENFLKGAINKKYLISMSVSVNGENINGYYSYAKGEPIYLSGKFIGGSINMSEFVKDKNTGYFNLNHADNKFYGQWSNGTKTYDVDLHKYLF
jgi:hypothetical protein